MDIVTRLFSLFYPSIAMRWMPKLLRHYLRFLYLTLVKRRDALSPILPPPLTSINIHLDTHKLSMLPCRKRNEVRLSIGRFFNCSVSDATYTRKIEFLTKSQFSENTFCKLFAKNVTDDLATVHKYLCNV